MSGHNIRSQAWLKKWNEFAVKLCELDLQLEGREQEGQEQSLVLLESSSPSSSVA